MPMANLASGRARLSERAALWFDSGALGETRPTVNINAFRTSRFSLRLGCITVEVLGMNRWTWFAICLVTGAVLVVAGLLIPAHLRAVDEAVLKAAGESFDPTPMEA